jgi:23S rRNA pseudouridine2605 synthase
MRLNQFLAKAGVASRRKADILIEEGHVSINGKVVTKLGIQVDEIHDKVAIDGKAAQVIPEQIYLMLHKPVSYLVTVEDELGRPTVLDLVGKYRKIVRPVGRLDLNSSGLLILTNDGELAFRLTHPRYEIEKTYFVRCDGFFTDEQIKRLEIGIEIEGKKTSPAKVELVSRAKNFSRLTIAIHEGRKRQVRLMCDALGHRVQSLKRISLGDLELGDLKEGALRHLTPGEVNILKKSVGL